MQLFSLVLVSSFLFFAFQVRAPRLLKSCFGKSRAVAPVLLATSGRRLSGAKKLAVNPLQQKALALDRAEVRRLRDEGGSYDEKLKALYARRLQAQNKEASWLSEVGGSHSRWARRAEGEVAAARKVIQQSSNEISETHRKANDSRAALERVQARINLMEGSVIPE